MTSRLLSDLQPEGKGRLKFQIPFFRQFREPLYGFLLSYSFSRARTSRKGYKNGIWNTSKRYADNAPIKKFSNCSDQYKLGIS